jgi:hypothetical protein
MQQMKRAKVETLPRDARTRAFKASPRNTFAHETLLRLALCRAWF